MIPRSHRRLSLARAGRPRGSLLVGQRAFDGGCLRQSACRGPKGRNASGLNSLAHENLRKNLKEFEDRRAAAGL
jgi:hypothetical protein